MFERTNEWREWKRWNNERPMANTRPLTWVCNSCPLFSLYNTACTLWKYPHTECLHSSPDERGARPGSVRWTAGGQLRERHNSHLALHDVQLVWHALLQAVLSRKNNNGDAQRRRIWRTSRCLDRWWKDGWMGGTMDACMHGGMGWINRRRDMWTTLWCFAANGQQTCGYFSALSFSQGVTPRVVATLCTDLFLRGWRGLGSYWVIQCYRVGNRSLLTILSLCPWVELQVCQEQIFY